MKQFLCSLQVFKNTNPLCVTPVPWSCPSNKLVLQTLVFGFNSVAGLTYAKRGCFRAINILTRQQVRWVPENPARMWHWHMSVRLLEHSSATRTQRVCALRCVAAAPWAARSRGRNCCNAVGAVLTDHASWWEEETLTSALHAWLQEW